MARIAHLVLAHQKPKQLARLVTRINQCNPDIYIHVDAKFPILGFQAMLSKEDNVFLLKDRRRMNWGGYSVVDATLAAFNEILTSGKPYDFINLMSETDYPLVPAPTIHTFLDQHLGKSFMAYEGAGSPWWEEAQPRVRKLHFDDYGFRGRFALQWILNMFPFQREIPFHLKLVGRSQWFTIAIRHVEYILQYVNKHPSITRFFKHTWGPDEFFFQTILFNSHFKEDLVNDNLRYIDWSKGGASPKILAMGDLDALKGSGKFYARKFDEQVDVRILAQLDEYIDNWS